MEDPCKSPPEAAIKMNDDDYVVEFDIPDLRLVKPLF